MKYSDGSIDDKLCTQCREFDRIMNGGSISSDVYVVCEHEERMEWISTKHKLPPKEGKFLFSYYYGIGLGEYGQCYTTINGNSERTHKCYILILWPSEIEEGREPYKWDEEKVKEMDLYWMPLPQSPKEQ